MSLNRFGQRVAPRIYLCDHLMAMQFDPFMGATFKRPAQYLLQKHTVLDENATFLFVET
jgi:hypothetical protein